MCRWEMVVASDCSLTARQLFVILLSVCLLSSHSQAVVLWSLLLSSHSQAVVCPTGVSLLSSHSQACLSYWSLLLSSHSQAVVCPTGACCCPLIVKQLFVLLDSIWIMVTVLLLLFLSCLKFFVILKANHTILPSCHFTAYFEALHKPDYRQAKCRKRSPELNLINMNTFWSKLPVLHVQKHYTKFYLLPRKKKTNPQVMSPCSNRNTLCYPSATRDTTVWRWRTKASKSKTELIKTKWILFGHVYGYDSSLNSCSPYIQSVKYICCCAHNQIFLCKKYKQETKKKHLNNLCLCWSLLSFSSYSRWCNV